MKFRIWKDCLAAWRYWAPRQGYRYREDVIKLAYNKRAMQKYSCYETFINSPFSLTTSLPHFVMASRTGRRLFPKSDRL